MGPGKDCVIKVGFCGLARPRSLQLCGSEKRAVCRKVNKGKRKKFRKNQRGMISLNLLGRGRVGVAVVRDDYYPHPFASLREAREPPRKGRVKSSYAPANFSSLIASKSATPPPTRLVT